MGANGIISAFRRRVFGCRVEETSLLQEHVVPLQNFQQQLVVHLSNDETLQLLYRPEQTVKDICGEIAKKINISPVVLPFCTLISKSDGHYFNQTRKLSKTECKQEYVFRLAFKACHASRFKEQDIKDRKAIAYLFHQSRQEFLQGSSITFSDEEDKKNFVKLVVLELIYRSSQSDVKPQKLVDDAKQHKVVGLLRRDIFAQYSIKEVKKYIKNHLKKFQGMSDDKLMLEYLHVVEQSDKYFDHKFMVCKHFYANGKRHIVDYELLISPQYGIKKKEVNQLNQAPEEIVKDFSHVCGLEIRNHEVVISRQESQAEVLLALSDQDAQSIVAIINGYYRLLVNRYRNLVTNDTTKHYMPKLHGPISRKMSMSILQAQGKEDGLYLVRQSRKVFGHYVLSLMQDKEIYHYEIVKEEDDQFVLKDTTNRVKFKTVDAFIKYYEESKEGLPVCLKKMCLPSDTGNDALLNSHPLVPFTPRPQDLNQFGLESIKALDIKQRSPIGKGGEFGNVVLSEWKVKEEDNPTKIVLRKLKKKIYDESFFEVEKRLLELRNINIIRHYGVTQFKDCLGLVIEYAMDNLEKYLKCAVSNPQGFSKKRVVLFAAQIAEGMMYLQNRQCVHGRLRAANILVATDEQIKIGDIGLLDLKIHGGEFMGVDKHHVSTGYCWHALELLSDPRIKPSHESDVWSLGVTMWEMFALKKPFHNQTSSKPLSRQEILRRYNRKQYLSTQRRNNLPEEVANIIQECWKPCEEERISFENIVIAMRVLIIKATPEQSKSFATPLIFNQETEDWEKPIKPTDKKQPPNQPFLITEGNNSYSMMAPSEDDNQCTGCLTTPHISYGTSVRVRKESVHRTFSDPGSPKHIYEEPTSEQLLTQPQRKISLTRTASYPQAMFFTSQEKRTSSDENGIPTSNQEKPNSLVDRCEAEPVVVDNFRPTSKTSGATLYCDQYHDQTHVSDNILGNLPFWVASNNGKDERDMCLNESLMESDHQTPTMDGEDSVMAFLKKQFSKVSKGNNDMAVANTTQDYKESYNNKTSQENKTTDVQAIEHNEYDAFDYLASLVQQERKKVNNTKSSCNSSQTLPAAIFNFNPHVCQETVIYFQSENSITGKDVHQAGVVTSSQSENSNTGKDVHQAGVVTSSKSGSGNTGQCVVHSSFNVGEYRDTTKFETVGTITTAKSHLHEENVRDTGNILLLKDDEDMTEMSMNHHEMDTDGNDNGGGFHETSEVRSGGWFCSPSYVTQTSVNGSRNETNVQENPEQEQPVTGKASHVFNPFQLETNSASTPEKLELGSVQTNKGYCTENDRVLSPLDTIRFPTGHEEEYCSQENLMKAKLEELCKKLCKDFLIEKGNLRTREQIGKGNFGSVRKGRLTIPINAHSSQIKDVAVKELLKCTDEKSQDDFINEAINMQELRKIKNVNIITPIGICLDIDKGTFMIVTELAPLGGLRNYLKDKKERIGVHKLLEFSLQIANGMLALEELNFLHRDLALRNILVAAENQVKISDFGLSRLSEYYKASGGKWPMKWYAPESLEKNTFTTKSEVWSFGVTLWEMFSYGKVPYPDVDNSGILDHILKGERLPQPENCPDGVYEIMQQCWKKDILERPSFYNVHDSMIPNEMKSIPKEETINCE